MASSSSSSPPKPDRPFKHVAAHTGEVLQVGNVAMRILEDGSNTDNRISSLLATIPGRTWATPPHYHAMHDETFFVTHGKLRFWAPGKPAVEVGPGEYVVVPTHAPHTFENAEAEEAVVLSTFTPAHYINYFKAMALVAASGEKPDFEKARKAMAEWATVPLDKGDGAQTA